MVRNRIFLIIYFIVLSVIILILLLGKKLEKEVMRSKKARITSTEPSNQIYTLNRSKLCTHLNLTFNV